MSEYKKDTVGWQLSRLKEPLRSTVSTVLVRVYSTSREKLEELLNSPASGICEALGVFSLNGDPMTNFWMGMEDFFSGGKPSFDNGCVEGYNMARECAPDPEPQNVGNEKPLTPESDDPEPFGGRLTTFQEHENRMKKLERRIDQLEKQIKYLMEYGSK